MKPSGKIQRNLKSLGSQVNDKMTTKGAKIEGLDEDKMQARRMSKTIRLAFDVDRTSEEGKDFSDEEIIIHEMTHIWDDRHGGRRQGDFETGFPKRELNPVHMQNIQRSIEAPPRSDSNSKAKGVGIEQEVGSVTGTWKWICFTQGRIHESRSASCEVPAATRARRSLQVG